MDTKTVGMPIALGVGIGILLFILLSAVSRIHSGGSPSENSGTLGVTRGETPVLVGSGDRQELPCAFVGTESPPTTGAVDLVSAGRASVSMSLACGIATDNTLGIDITTTWLDTDHRLKLGSGDDRSLHLSAEGVLRVEGTDTWVESAFMKDTSQHFTAKVVVTGDGDGALKLMTWGAADAIFLLKTSDGCFWGKSSPSQLHWWKLKHDLDAGKITQAQYDQAKNGLLEGVSSGRN